MRVGPITGAMLGLFLGACTYPDSELGSGRPPRPERPPLPPLAPATVAREALLAYWPLDEGRGGYAWDFTGNGNDGVLLPYTDPARNVVGPRWIAPGFTAATFPNVAQVSFDGVDDYVEFDAVLVPAIERPKSISLWVRYDYEVPLRGNVALFVLMNRDAGAALRIELHDHRLRASNYQMNSGSLELVGLQAPPQGTHHVVYTFDGTTHALFVDGKEPVTSTVVHGEVGKPKTCRIGRSSAGVPDAFKGFLDDVRVYDRALTMDEVQALHEGSP
jgi:hypothetical protein